MSNVHSREKIEDFVFSGPFFGGLGPGYPLFELGRPVASGIQSSFFILVGFGSDAIEIHDLVTSLVYGVLVWCLGY